MVVLCIRQDVHIKAKQVQCKSIPAIMPKTNSITQQTIYILQINRSEEYIVMDLIY